LSSQKLADWVLSEGIMSNEKDRFREDIISKRAFNGKKVSRT